LASVFEAPKNYRVLKGGGVQEKGILGGTTGPAVKNSDFCFVAMKPMGETTYRYNLTVEPHKVKISCIFFGESKNGDRFFIPQHLRCRVGKKNLIPYQVLLGFVL